MTWGRDTDEDDAADQLKAFRRGRRHALDTADVYVDGESERVVGRLLQGVVRREDVIVATKAVVATRTGDATATPPARHLLNALDASLDGCGRRYVDLWQMHAWDDAHPDRGDARRARHRGVVPAGRATSASPTTAAGRPPRPRPGSRLARPRAARVDADGVLACCNAASSARSCRRRRDLGIGILPWSPLGRGVLTGKYRTGTPADSRGASPDYQRFVAPYLDDRAPGIVGSVITAADGLGVSPLAVALAWVRDRPGVVAPIVGARTAAQLKGSLDADDVVLPDEIREALDDVSMPSKSGYPEARAILAADAEATGARAAGRPGPARGCVGRRPRGSPNGYATGGPRIWSPPRANRRSCGSRPAAKFTDSAAMLLTRDGLEQSIERTRSPGTARRGSRP